MKDIKQKEYILFDLDGTISDSSDGIMKSVDRALRLCGVEEDYQSLTKFIGPSLRYSFSFYSDDEEVRAKMLALYRERYSTIGWSENVMYDGMADLLKSLNDAGKKVVLCSAKPEEFCDKILKLFHIYEMFYFVGGATLDGSRDDKTILLKYVLDKLGNPNKDDVVMIGDRFYDILCAQNNGVTSVGVKYGFAPEGELEKAGADYIVNTVAELKNLLL